MIKEFFKNKKDNIYSILKYFFLITILVFLSYSNFNLYQEKKERDKEIAKLKSEVEKEEERCQELQQDISETEKEEYWEERIREQGYKKPGEKQVVVLPSKEEIPTTTKTKESFWEKIKSSFTNLLNF